MVLYCPPQSLLNENFIIKNVKMGSYCNYDICNVQISLQIFQNIFSLEKGI